MSAMSVSAVEQAAADDPGLYRELLVALKSQRMEIERLKRENIELKHQAESSAVRLNREKKIADLVMRHGDRMQQTMHQRIISGDPSLLEEFPDIMHQADEIRGMLDRIELLEKDLEISNATVEQKDQILQVVSEHGDRVQKALQEKQRQIAKDVAFAKRIQQASLPDTEQVNDFNIEIGMAFRPFQDLSGDIYDFFEVDDAFYTFIADVSGKGLPASLLTLMIKANFDSFVRATPDSLKATLDRMNRMVFVTSPPEMFTTMYALRLTKDYKMQFSNCGHHEALIRRNDKILSAGDESANNPLLGVFEEYETEIGEIQLQSRDTVVIYSDGLVETKTHRSATEGKMALRRWLSTGHINQLPASALSEKLEEMALADGVTDDLSIMVLHVK